ncbi:hypothetical protein ORJ66_04890 [Pseudoalteromonas tunicata]|uniref:hypothetical protein n=1 Tax=Pseudoalteromonas tunicata TaxID=314281 RepID=UPI00273F11E0|nr:hypothetical protein [Pseudoalteromonas tunicata]MDP5212378.1 hypothetical protein [Pseudoalteromonas tunicata]
MELKKPSDNCFTEVDGFGVAICNYAGDQNHLAILYKNPQKPDDVKLFHVNSYKSDLLTPVESHYLWVDIDWLPPIRKIAITANLKNIIDNNKDTKIRYGFSFNLGCFDPVTGKINNFYDSADGFTCATFVLEVLKSLGVELVDWNSWPVASPEDINFKQYILSQLESYSVKYPDIVTEEFLLGQKNKINDPRFKPQEVIAATKCKEASTYNSIQKPAQLVHEEVLSYSN